MINIKTASIRLNSHLIHSSVSILFFMMIAMVSQPHASIMLKGRIYDEQSNPVSGAIVALVKNRLIDGR